MTNKKRTDVFLFLVSFLPFSFVFRRSLGHSLCFSSAPPLPLRFFVSYCLFFLFFVLVFVLLFLGVASAVSVCGVQSECRVGLRRPQCVV